MNSSCFIWCGLVWVFRILVWFKGVVATLLGRCCWSAVISIILGTLNSLCLKWRAAQEPTWQMMRLMAVWTSQSSMFFNRSGPEGSSASASPVQTAAQSHLTSLFHVSYGPDSHIVITKCCQPLFLPVLSLCVQQEDEERAEPLNRLITSDSTASLPPQPGLRGRFWCCQRHPPFT